MTGSGRTGSEDSRPDLALEVLVVGSRVGTAGHGDGASGARSVLECQCALGRMIGMARCADGKIGRDLPNVLSMRKTRGSRFMADTAGGDARCSQ